MAKQTMGLPPAGQGPGPKQPKVKAPKMRGSSYTNPMSILGKTAPANTGRDTLMRAAENNTALVNEMHKMAKGPSPVKAKKKPKRQY